MLYSDSIQSISFFRRAEKFVFLTKDKQFKSFHEAPAIRHEPSFILYRLSLNSNLNMYMWIVRRIGGLEVPRPTIS